MKIKNFLVMAVAIISIIAGTRYWDMHIPNLQAGVNYYDEWQLGTLLSLPWLGAIVTIAGCIIYMIQIEILEQKSKQKEKKMQDETE